ncbi:hypothetical protein Pres01_48200 [Metapseudomonas resinovorans]|nr:hypothetical protein Pres01_48200 [Pseudomonas resinovorans]
MMNSLLPTTKPPRARASSGRERRVLGFMRVPVAGLFCEGRGFYAHFLAGGLPLEQVGRLHL